MGKPSRLPESGPAHVGIIMDGNGRWARLRGLPRSRGHQEGLQAARGIVQSAAELGLSYLTLYVFSTENWKRTSDEVGFIMGLVRQYLKKEIDFCKSNFIRVRHAGNRKGLDEDILNDLDDVCRETEHFSGLQVILALNYGGRDEIIRAIGKVTERGLPLSEENLTLCLDNPDIPEPDLIIRTAGEFRTSNFLLWQGAYSEYHISSKLWPDWTGSDLEEAINIYNMRERRFGAVYEDVR
ncbi:MAG: polyprenyl diphosphate synthase [Treponema sp.]|nr:polyprenyl diphosphate synthase [Treponema sp.]